MKQRKTASIIFAAGMLLLAGCQKDDLQGRGERMMLNLEAFGSGSKTVLGADDRSLQWLSGDQVRINGVDYTVSTSGDEAYVSDVPEASSYKALFPASMAEGRSMSGTTVTATLPRQYEYRTEGGLQVLDAPLAAVGDGSEGLTFRHLTGALTVVIKNTTSNTLYIDSVVLSSAQQLCGDITVDFDNLTAVSPNTEPSNSDTMVLLTVPYNTLSVAAGGEVKVQIPVLPVSDANRFTVHVATRYQGTRYDFDRRQGATSNALARNEMGYVPASIATSGRYISVRPLFDYNSESPSNNEFYIKTKLDVQLLSEATQGNGYSVPLWESIGFAFSNYMDFNIIIPNDIDMEGAAINSIHTKRYFRGRGSKISNLTVNGNALLGDRSYDDIDYDIEIDLENIIINSPSSLCGAVLGYVSSNKGHMVACNVENVTFNISISSNSSVFIGGIVGNYELWGDASIDLGGSVHNVQVNFDQNQPYAIYFGGIAGYAGSMYQGEVVGDSYIQDTPLLLQANNVYYGGMCGCLNYTVLCEKPSYTICVSEIKHNVTINATNELKVGGVYGSMGFTDDCGHSFEGQSADVYNGCGGTILGSIIYNNPARTFVDTIGVIHNIDGQDYEHFYSLGLNLYGEAETNTSDLTLTQQ